MKKMSQQDIVLNKFKLWKPLPPEVAARSSRHVTLIYSAGVYSFLEGLLIYKIEKKDKIPPWTVVYSGGKTTTTIQNLAPSHPHRFRLRVIIKSTSKLAALLENNDDLAILELNEIDQSDCKDGKGNNSSDDKASSARPHTMACQKKILSYQMFEELDQRICTTTYGTGCNWAASQWSDEVWTSTDSEGTSAACFCMAVRCGYMKHVQQMLEERPSLISVVNSSSGLTALATAARKGNVNMVRFLLLSNAEIEQRSSIGQTPLHLAVLAGHTEVSEILLEKGADFEARDLNQLRVEHYAVDSCRLDIVRFILDRGGDVSVTDSNGWTPLFRALCQGAKTEVIEELVRRGSDIHISDKRKLSLVAAARLLTDQHGRRRESVLKLVDPQFQHDKVVASFTRLTKKISSVHTLLTIK